jgi:UPF0271 protein
MLADLNCDMGEGFALYKMGDDAALMPHITQANVACGFHASDANHMQRTVELAREYGVRVGAHFSYPDLQGFGRREMKIGREELANLLLYQVGALSAFLRRAGLSLSHLKPHGALYGVAARDEETAQAVADVAKVYDVPVMGLAGTLHEEVYTGRGVEFLAEFFADLEYSDEGKLIITREHEAVDPKLAARRALQAVRDGTLTTVGGRTLPVRAQTVCVHSDTPGAAEVAAAVRAALETGHVD